MRNAAPVPRRVIVALLIMVGGVPAGCSNDADPTPVSVSATVSTTTTAAPLPMTVTSQPPPPPPPPTGPVPVYTTGHHPLATPIALPRQVCALPAWPEDNREVMGFLTTAVGCLDRTWRPVLARLRLPFRPAQVRLVEELATAELPDLSKCGRPPEHNSFYCDGRIFLAPASYLATEEGEGAVPAAAIGLLAHEYGHHIQQLGGLLPESVLEINIAGANTEAGLELSRRVELQAQCFAGLFVGATFDRASINRVRRDNYTRGDLPGLPADHGSRKTFGDWFTKGTHRNSLAVCDTWSAPASAVR